MYLDSDMVSCVTNLDFSKSRQLFSKLNNDRPTLRESHLLMEW